jgi:hypothetical protein
MISLVFSGFFWLISEDKRRVSFQYLVYIFYNHLMK